MAFKMQIIDNVNNFNFWVKYENLSKTERPAVVAKSPNGIEVKERTVFQGQALLPGSTQKLWVDDQGNIYQKEELTFWCGDQTVQENRQTKVFEVVDYKPLAEYTDRYILEKYYELFPHDNDHKKDFDKRAAESINLSGMYKLWKYLKDNNVVARGEFCPSSRGFLASDGFIRAIQFDNKWSLSVGMFKEEQIFSHLQEGQPTAVAETPVMAQSGRVKLKLV